MFSQTIILCSHTSINVLLKDTGWITISNQQRSSGYRQGFLMQMRWGFEQPLDLPAECSATVSAVMFMFSECKLHIALHTPVYFIVPQPVLHNTTCEHITLFWRHAIILFCTVLKISYHLSLWIILKLYDKGRSNLWTTWCMWVEMNCTKPQTIFNEDLLHCQYINTQAYIAG